MNANRFVALDSWRGVCALLVAIHNLNDPRWMLQFKFVIHSSLFVDFFFVLSGFVITHAYGDRLTSLPEVGAFLVRRIGRLWPLHVAVMVILIGMFYGVLLLQLAAARLLHHPIELAFNSLSLRTVVANLLLLQSFDIPSRLSLNAPSWSISTELYTYFLFAGVCLYSASRGTSTRLIMSCFVLLSAGVVALFSAPYLATNTDYAFFRCLYGFSVGHLVYAAWKFVQLPRRNAAAAEWLVLMLIFAFVSMVGSDVASMAAPLLFGLAVWIFAQQEGHVSKALMTRPFVQLGTWSYSIYMVHWLVRNLIIRGDQIIGQAMGRSLPGNDMPVGNTWTMCMAAVGYLVVVIVLAGFTYRWIEQPGRALFNRLSARLVVASQPVH